MKAIVFSIGEVTTALCAELLNEFGFDVQVWQDKTSFYDKLNKFYKAFDEDILRIDADIIPTANVKKLVQLEDNCIWHQCMGWDWYKHDIAPISINYYRQPMFETARQHIEKAKYLNRPESYIYRLEQFHWPRVCHVTDLVCGLHGYKQTDQRQRIKILKAEREQDYDWALVDKLEAL